MKKIFLLFASLLVISVTAYSQGADCASAQPACADSLVTFPASTNTTAQSGPDYGCLSTQPNPAWFYFEIDVAGNLTIEITNSINNDVDFIIWGPFSSPTGNCGNLTGANAVDCGYSNSATETADITGANVGDFYILLITNYTGTATNISLTQSAGNGSTDCGVFIPTCSVEGTATPTICDTITGKYDVSGNITFSNAPTTGTLKITDLVNGASQIFNAPFTNPQPYNLTSMTSDGLPHDLAIAFSDSTTCQDTLTYVSPPSCGICTAYAGADNVVCDTLQYQLQAVLANAIDTGYWSGPAGVIFSDSSLANAVVTVPSIGNYTFTWNATNPIFGCNASDDVTISFNKEGSVSNVQVNCSPINIFYTISFDINGGSPGQYTVTDINGIQLAADTNNTFVSLPIGKGNYQFTVDNGCTPIVISGNANCPCLSDAGSMDLSQLDVCGNDTAMATFLGGEFIDSDDNHFFVLHTNSGAQLAPFGLGVIATNTVPKFTFQSGAMQYGQTYYISSVVGNNDYIGGIDLNDTCMSVAQGTPVVFYDQPNGWITADPDTVCEGDAMGLTFHTNAVGNVFDLRYTDGVNTFIVPGVDSGYVHTIFPSVSATYTLIDVSLSGTSCSWTNNAPLTMNVPVHVNPIPTGIINATTLDVCQGDSVGLYFNLTTNGPFNVVYEEITPAGVPNIQNTISNINSGDTTWVTPTQTATYRLVMVQDNSQPYHCMSSSLFGSQVTIEVNPYPTHPNLADLTVCNNITSPLTGPSSFPNFTYQWSPNTGLNNFLGAQTTFTLPNGGTLPYDTDYSLSITDPTTPANCTTIDTMIVTVNPEPCFCYSVAGTMSTDTISVCGSNPANAIHNGDDFQETNDAICYFLHTGSSNSLGTILGTNTTPNFTYNGGLTYETIYYISAVVGNDDGFGCVDLNDTCLSVATGQPVVFHELPEVVLSGSTTICNGAVTNLNFNFTAGQGPYDVIYTDGTNNYSLNNINNGHNEPILPVNNGIVPTTVNYNVVQVSDNSNPACTGFFTGTAAVVVNPAPTGQIISTVTNTNSVSICNGESTDLVFVLNGNGPFNVQYSNGTSIVTANGINSGYTISVNPGVTTNYQILNISDNSAPQCTNNGSGSITVVNVLPVPASITLTDFSICSGETSAPVGVATQPNFTYTWSTNDPIANPLSNLSNPGPGSTANYTTFTIGNLATVPQTHTYTLTVSDNTNVNSAGNTCSVSDEVIITVNPLPTTLINGNFDLCFGFDTVLNITELTGATYNYQWNPQQYLSNYNGNNPQTLPGMPIGSHQYIIEVTDNNNCVNVDTTMVVVHPIPNVEVQANPTFGCYPLTVDFTSTVIPSESTDAYQWAFGNGNFATDYSSTTYTYDTVGTYIVGLDVISQYGCKGTANFPPTINPFGPVANFTFDPQPTTTENTTVTFINTSLNANDYQWIFTIDSFGNEIATTVIDTAILYPYDDKGVYPFCLVAMDNYGCVDTLCNEVVIDGEYFFYMPNAFTPNGDKINDVFKPSKIGISVKNYKFEVFNRWGELMFQTDNVYEAWIGTKNNKTDGKVLKTGVYIWRMKATDAFTGNEYDYVGKVTLINSKE